MSTGAGIEKASSRLIPSSSILALVPLVWLAIGIFVYIGGVVTTLLPCSAAAACRSAGSWVGFIIVVAFIPQLAWRFVRDVNLSPIRVLDAVAVAPWIVAMGHQVLPYWNDAAHYMNSAALLFQGQASLSELVLMNGSEVYVQGDFHGPAYLFLHWPYVLLSSLGVEIIGSTALTYFGIIFLKACALIAVIVAIRPLVGETGAQIYVLALFFIPFTRYIFSGTHREWFLMYVLSLAGIQLALKSSSLWMRVLMGFLLAQSHATAILIFGALVPVLLASRRHRRSALGFMSGGVLGYLPLLLGTLVYGTGRNIGITSFATGFGAAAIQAYDGHRLVHREIPLVNWTLQTPPLSWFSLGVLVVGSLYALKLAAATSPKRNPIAVRAVIGYVVICFSVYLGLVDAVLARVGFADSWFSLRRLFSSNDRYWFTVFSAVLLFLIPPLENTIRFALRRVLVPATGVAALVVATIAPLLTAVILGVYSAPASRGRRLLMPGDALGVDYVEAYVRATTPRSITLVAVGIAVLALVYWPGSRRIPAILVLSTFALASAYSPINTYARATTASVLVTIDDWNFLRQELVWSNGCVVGAQLSTHRLFFDSLEVPAIYVTAPVFDYLYAPAADASVQDAKRDMPCAIFEEGLLLWSNDDSVFFTDFDLLVRRQGYSIRLDSARVEIPAEFEQFLLD